MNHVARHERDTRWTYLDDSEVGDDLSRAVQDTLMTIREVEHCLRRHVMDERLRPEASWSDHQLLRHGRPPFAYALRLANHDVGSLARSSDGLAGRHRIHRAPPARASGRDNDVIAVGHNEPRRTPRPRASTADLSPLVAHGPRGRRNHAPTLAIVPKQDYPFTSERASGRDRSLSRRLPRIQHRAQPCG
jgi:hypothetical protein